MLHEIPSACVEELAAQRQKILAQHEAKRQQQQQQQQEDAKPAVAEWAQSKTREEDISAFQASLPNIKQKTRRATDANDEDEVEGRLDDNSLSPARKSKGLFILPRKLFSVIRHIFTTPDENPEGTIAWQSFLNLMAELGCSIETNGGLAFAFILKDHGRIVIHWPHPDSTLQSYHLRNLAAGLANQFGWQRENSKGPA